MKLSYIILFTGSVSAFLAPRSNSPAPYNTAHPDYAVPDTYVVRFHANHTLDDHCHNIGMDVRQVAVSFTEMPMSNAYSFTLSEGNSSLVHDFIRHDPGVLRVDHDEYLQEEDIWQGTEHVPRGTRLDRLRMKGKRWFQQHVEKDSWNFAMITMGKKFDFKGDIMGSYPSYTTATSGEGVNVYVFDSGIKVEHDSFQGSDRQIAVHFQGKKATDKSPYCGIGTSSKLNMDDHMGHGTKVASIISDKYGGAAIRATVINVKVSDCAGMISQKEKAVGDVITEHRAHKANPPKGWKGSVINMSIAIRNGNTDGLQDILKKAYDEGIPVAAAAGNSNAESIEKPAMFRSVFSVGAVDINYNRWRGGVGFLRGSNYNKKLNIWAPGKDIYGAHVDPQNPKDTTRRDYGSGSSMACPHVAGVMAIIMSYEGYDKLTAEDVYARITENSITAVNPDNELTKSLTTLQLLQSGIDGGAGGAWDKPYNIPKLDHDESKKRGVWNLITSRATEITVGIPRPQPSAPPTGDNDLDQQMWDNDGNNTVSPSTTNAPPLPTLSKSCLTSTLFNCKYIFNPVTDLANCPTTTAVLPASCIANPTPAPPAPTRPPPAVAPVRYARLMFYHEIGSNGQNSLNFWNLYIYPVSVSPRVCQDKIGTFNDEGIKPIDNLPSPMVWPLGTFTMPTGLGADGCVYKGDRSGPGILTCQGKPDVSCTEEKDASKECNKFSAVYPKVVCGVT